MTDRCTIEEAKSFITEATKARSNWLTIAEKSWRELKRRDKQGKIWAIEPNALRKRARYPIWFSIYKIRQAILLSRVGIPIGRDTTQDGSDNIGATAAVCLERLATNLPRNFDFFEVLCAARNDFQATDFGFVRAYYQCDEITERVKEYIQPQKGDDGTMEFFDSEGEVVTSDTVMQDDEGFYLEHKETVDIDNEKVLLKHVLYKRVYIDPQVEQWADVKRLGFECLYSERDFISIFGREAFNKLPKLDPSGSSEDANSAEKRQDIVVIEYWDWYDKSCYWFAKEGEDFIEPKSMLIPEEEDEQYDDEETDNGLYDLDRFFPCPKPLLNNQTTDEFWPVPEYFQLIEIFESIHHIFSVMFRCTRAIRPRLLYDNNVEGLKAAISEASDNDAIGVSNLTQALLASGGSLENVVQYIPVDKIVAALSQLSDQLNQRLETVYKLTGTGDLIQGMTSDGSGKTLGERQIEEKYALNQIAEPQRKVAEFVRDCYQLMTEVALKNFSEASLEQYIIPQTMDPEHQQNFKAALGLLKETRKSRFRIELETDSTLALNEEYDKKMRIEFVNALTTALEKTAATAKDMPELAIPELHAMKFLIQGFRQGKMFQSEVTQAIDQTIQNIQNAPPKDDFNPDKVAATQKDQELQQNERKIELDFELRQLTMQSDERLATIKLQQDQQLAAVNAQIEQMKIASDNQQTANDLQFEYQKLASDNQQAMSKLQAQYQEIGAGISEAQEKLAIARDALVVQMRGITSGQEIEQFKAMMAQQTSPIEAQLNAQEQALEQARLTLQAQELALTDGHVKTEQALEAMRLKLEGTQTAINAAKPPEMPPVTIHMPAPVAKTKKLKVKKDKFGNVQSLEAIDKQEPTDE